VSGVAESVSLGAPFLLAEFAVEDTPAMLEDLVAGEGLKPF
jgi:hypothetical protein